MKNLLKQIKIQWDKKFFKKMEQAEEEKIKKF